MQIANHYSTESITPIQIRNCRLDTKTHVQYKAALYCSLYIKSLISVMSEDNEEANVIRSLIKHVLVAACNQHGFE